MSNIVIRATQAASPVIKATQSSSPVVRPANSPGPQGPAAPPVAIQYSADNSSWHDEYVDGDKYIRFSTDDGETWGNGIYFNNLSETIEWVTKAKAWAENPEDVEVEAGKYSALHHAAKAAASASNAATSEANAATSEANAATSATNAAQSETNAAASEEKAHKWAQEAEGVEVETGEYSAYHWAMKAKDTVRSPFAYPFIECGLAGIETDIIITGGTASSVGAYLLSGGNANEPV